MGRKCIGTGKYLHICFAVVICITLGGCVTSDEIAGKTTDGPTWRFLKANRADSEPDYSSVADSGASKADSMFNTALAYLDVKNPSRDTIRGIAALKNAETTYPKTIWSYRSRVVSDLLQENLRLKKQTIDVQQENTKAKKQLVELQQENTKLKEIIEQSKKIDIEMEQKKRE